MYILPESLRNELKKPLGKVVDENRIMDEIKNRKVTAVGDAVAVTIYEKGVVPDLTVVDFKIMRKELNGLREKVSHIGNRVVRINNPPGTITDELWQAVKDAYDVDEKTRIEVMGEEDLAALPCIFLAPENSVVVYGLPGKGIVTVNVNEGKKQLVGKVLGKMSTG